MNQQTQAQAQEGKAAQEDNVIYVGNRPPMNYVLAVISQFNTGQGEVILKARGRAINVAVDVAEIVRRKFVPDAKPEGIEIDTEDIIIEEGKTRKVSSITIHLKK